MVSFICNACGNTVKKNQVEKHYQTVCRSCSVLSCIDCGVDFPGDAYKAHTSCITEAEKYQGHLYQPKDRQNKGDAKQKEWMQVVQNSTKQVKNPKIKSLLIKIADYSNVPRKKKKFENFCKNSVRVYDQKTLDELWDAFIGTNDNNATVGNGIKDNGNVANGEDINGDSRDKQSGKPDRKRKNANEDEENIEQTKIIKIDRDDNKGASFKWNKTMKKILRENEEEKMSVKKFRKKVIKAYKEFYLSNHEQEDRPGKEELKILFEQKSSSYSKIHIKEKFVTFVS